MSSGDFKRRLVLDIMEITVQYCMDNASLLSNFQSDHVIRHCDNMLLQLYPQQAPSESADKKYDSLRILFGGNPPYLAYRIFVSNVILYINTLTIAQIRDLNRDLVRIRCHDACDWDLMRIRSVIERRIPGAISWFYLLMKHDVFVPHSSIVPTSSYSSSSSSSSTPQVATIPESVLVASSTSPLRPTAVEHVRLKRSRDEESIVAVAETPSFKAIKLMSEGLSAAETHDVFCRGLRMLARIFEEELDL